MVKNELDTARYEKTFGVTLQLQKDIIDFLSSKHTDNATLSIEEIVTLYACTPDRAKRVVAALEKDELLYRMEDGTYKVTI